MTKIFVAKTSNGAHAVRLSSRDAERQEGMSLVAGTPIIDVLTMEDIAHRKGFWEFVETHGAPWHKQHLGRFLELLSLIHI